MNHERQYQLKILKASTELLFKKLSTTKLFYYLNGYKRERERDLFSNQINVQLNQFYMHIFY